MNESRLSMKSSPLGSFCSRKHRIRRDVEQTRDRQTDVRVRRRFKTHRDSCVHSRVYRVDQIVITPFPFMVLDHTHDIRCKLNRVNDERENY